MRKVIVLCGLAVLWLSACALAQEQNAQPQALHLPMNEISVSGNWETGDHSSGADATLGYGRYLTRRTELKVSGAYSRRTYELPVFGRPYVEDAKYWVITPALSLDLVPREVSSMVPYVGAGYYFFFYDENLTDDDRSDPVYFIGLRIYPNSTGATARWALTLEYRTFSGYFDDSESVKRTTLGISAYF